MNGQRAWLNAAVTQTEGVSKAFRHRFTGPYEIAEMIGLDAARLKLRKSITIHSVFHASLLAPLVPNPS